MIITWTNDTDNDRHITGCTHDASLRVSIDKSAIDETSAGVVCVLASGQRQHEERVPASVARAAGLMLRVHLGGFKHSSLYVQSLNHSAPVRYDRSMRPFSIDLDSFLDFARDIAEQDEETHHPQIERSAGDVE